MKAAEPDLPHSRLAIYRALLEKKDPKTFARWGSLRVRWTALATAVIHRVIRD